ncbi:lycopene cyclase domain-containing protein [Microbacterium sp. NPDC076911]|uniref:lycopene cyclase domain-containing protein n=1 Tax=Microbacterium sp. NPDC076911 TaxID=3154958 RepID=UPI00342056E1
MTYPLIIVPFAVITILVTLLSAIRPNFGRRMLASTLAAAFVCVLTAIFDNLMIAADLVVYPAEHLSGIFIGLAPIEDFSYSVCAAFLVPAVFVLLRRTPGERMPE